MRARDLQALTVDELKTRLVELRDERFKLKFRSATEAIDNPMRFRTVRRDIARVETILRARQA
ncbi:MAG: 50S ribosomal protein L29 [Gemmatimonadetes bacterium]|jgi:large subunit ribosomal protein L29|nr:50S ribosomal protein L29 [Gemmatimonadota bacterium]